MTALDVIRSFSPAGGWTPAPVPHLEARDVSGLANPSGWLVDALTGGRTSSGHSVSIEGALGIDAVLACVQLIAGQAASLPLPVYRGTGRGRQRATTDYRYRMLHDSPNPVTTSDVFVEALLATMMLWGNGYAEKVRDKAGVVRELWNMNPKGITVERTPDGRKLFHVPGENTPLGVDRVLHVPAFGYDGVRGRSVIELARETLGTLRAREDYEGRFYANDATPGGILSVDGELSEPAARRLKAQWESAHGGAANRHRVAVLEGGTTWQSMGLPLKDQEWIERSRFSVVQVARLFLVAPELIGGERGGSLTYSTVEGQAIQFVTFTLRRWLVRVERVLRADLDLFAGSDLYPEFLIEGLLRADSAGRAGFYRALWDMGAISANEIRERENMPPIDGPEGDRYGPAAATGGAPAPGVEEPGGAGAPALDEARARLEALASVA